MTSHLDTPKLRAAIDRYDTINRAIALIDTADPASLAAWLAQTDLHDHIKADPATLRQHLADANGTAQVFSAWKASQQLLKAAGQPY
jgi:hypothetical protein